MHKKSDLSFDPSVVYRVVGTATTATNNKLTGGWENAFLAYLRWTEKTILWVIEEKEDGTSRKYINQYPNIIIALCGIQVTPSYKYNIHSR